MDAYDLWEHREIEYERKLARLPVCSLCGERIQEEELIDYEGKLFHEHCFLGEYRKWTEDYET
jgi:formylmethanofuran dehydrogenase subunit E